MDRQTLEMFLWRFGGFNKNDQMVIPIDHLIIFIDGSVGGSESLTDPRGLTTWLDHQTLEMIFRKFRGFNKNGQMVIPIDHLIIFIERSEGVSNIPGVGGGSDNMVGPPTS